MFAGTLALKGGTFQSINTHQLWTTFVKAFHVLFAKGPQNMAQMGAQEGTGLRTIWAIKSLAWSSAVHCANVGL